MQLSVSHRNLSPSRLRVASTSGQHPTRFSAKMLGTRSSLHNTRRAFGAVPHFSTRCPNQGAQRSRTSWHLVAMTQPRDVRNYQLPALGRRASTNHRDVGPGPFTFGSYCRVDAARSCLATTSAIPSTPRMRSSDADKHLQRGGRHVDHDRPRIA